MGQVRHGSATTMSAVSARRTGPRPALTDHPEDVETPGPSRKAGADFMLETHPCSALRI